MGSSFGKNIKISLFGESHSYCVGLTIDGLKAGIYIDQEYLEDELKKRKTHDDLSTSRNEEDKIISKDILIYICNDAFNFLYSALVDFPNCACPKCSCHEYISDKCRGEHFVRSRYAPAHYSNHVENISDFYTLLRRYIGIVFILLFQRHNHSDFIALKIC